MQIKYFVLLKRVFTYILVYIHIGKIKKQSEKRMSSLYVKRCQNIDWTDFCGDEMEILEHAEYTPFTSFLYEGKNFDYSVNYC